MWCIPSWLYSALPGNVRSLTARDARPEFEDEAAQMECSDWGDAETDFKEPVMQKQLLVACLLKLAYCGLHEQQSTLWAASVAADSSLFLLMPYTMPN